MTERFAVSLPGGIPSGIIHVIPISAVRARASMAGVSAASSGVLPPSSSLGSSAIPSPKITAYFILIPPAKTLVSFYPLFFFLNKIYVIHILFAAGNAPMHCSGSYE